MLLLGLRKYLRSLSPSFMSLAVSAARLILFAVFIVSGTAKLLDRPGTRKAVVDFGLPHWLGGICAMVLPIAELAIAAALLSAATAWFAAMAAAALLGAFVVAIAYNLALGRRPDCHCFGQ